MKPIQQRLEKVNFARDDELKPIRKNTVHFCWDSTTVVF